MKYHYKKYFIVILLTFSLTFPVAYYFGKYSTTVILSSQIVDEHFPVLNMPLRFDMGPFILLTTDDFSSFAFGRRKAKEKGLRAIVNSCV
jgi:hypothetical protein